MPETRLADPPVWGQQSPPRDTAGTPADLWSPCFPSPDGLDLAAGLFNRLPTWDGEEGPRHRLVLAAGLFAVEAPDLARRERRHERAEQARRTSADQAATYLARGEDIPESDPCREITGWSRKSRTNMVRALCEIDYRPLLADPTRLPAMVTLTYPGDWLTVAPDGKTAKGHLAAFRRRYERAWDRELVAVWKLEFQRRGAPHFHLLMVPPHGVARTPGVRARADAWVGAGLPFRQWLSAVWADIVGHPDPEEHRYHQLAGTGVDYNEALRARDPKRVAVYFTKHGSFAAKEYQNCVPPEWQEPGKGPGRFWGYWRLERVAVAVEVTPDNGIRAARIARRWARAQGTTRQVNAPRTKGGRLLPGHATVDGLAGAQLVQAAAPTRTRKVRRRVRRLGTGKGFVSVNNGQLFALAVARALDVWSAEVLSRGSIEVRLERRRAISTSVNQYSMID
jgi:hypothetical protein